MRSHHVITLHRTGLNEAPGIGAALRPARASRVFRDERGFSLVEILVASVIVGISAVGMALMISTGQASVHGEGDTRVALYLAQQKVEQLRSQGYVSLNALALSTTFNPQTDTLPSGFSYSRMWQLQCLNRDDYNGSPLADCPGIAAVRIKVTVQASGPNDIKARAVTVMSIMAPR